MKKVEEFQKTQNLINEYNKLEDKITTYKNEQKKLLTEKDIIKQTYTTGVKKEEYKGYEDFEEKLKQDVDEYHIDPRDLEKEYEDKIKKVDEDLEKVEETHKFFSNDNNFKIITMEMKEMEEAIKEAEMEKNVEIAKLDLQWNELMAKKDSDGALEKRKEKEATIKTFDKEINKLKDKLSEYAKFKEKLNEKLKGFTVDDFRKMQEMTEPEKTTDPKTTDPKTTEPKTTEPKATESKTTDSNTTETKATKPKTSLRDIFSSSKDVFNSIGINAAEGKAYVKISKKEDKTEEIKELDIDEIINNKKEIFKDADVNALLEKAGIDSRFGKFMARRKINPVILKAIENDPDLTYEYIEAVVDEKEYPFDYKIDLTNSKLSKKSNNVLNKIALKERKIEGNEVIGAEKFYKIKNLFRNIKNNSLGEGNKRLQLTEGNVKEKQGNFKKKFVVNIEDLQEEQKKETDLAYSKLSQEQKDNLRNLSVSEIQKLGMSYNTAANMKKEYGTEEPTSNSTGTQQNEPEK